MKSMTRGNLKAATAAVRGTKGRSIFTMLGIIIGIVSVVTIVSIGVGVKHQISGQIDQLGHDLITVRPGRLTGNANQGGLNLLTGLTVSGALSRQDLAVITNTKGVKTAVPLSIVTGSPKGENGVYKNGLVIGTSSALPDVLHQSLAFSSGFFSDENNGDNVAVLGQRAAHRMFNEDVPLGRSFDFRGEQFIVRGIFNEFDAAPLSVEADFNNAIFIPDGTAENITGNHAPIYEVLVRPVNSSQTDAVVDSIEASLSKAHGGQKDFAVLKQSESLAASKKILDLLTRLVAGVAAISLLVGGVGIMNIMLVSVTERMHEIGIRKAIGATNRQILNQFVIESTVLSVVGGIIGVIISFIIEVALRMFTDIKPIISWWVVVLAVGVSLAVGIIFGAIPALKAARKDPIDALRNE